MTRKLRRWAALPADERLEVAEAWLLLLVVDLALRWLDLRRVERLLDTLSRRARRPSDSPPPDVARLQAWVASAAANHLGKPRCLHRSLVLRAMLSRRNWPTDLRIGVRRRGGLLEAHAWLEHEGAPLSCERPAAVGYRKLSPAEAGR